MDLAIAKWQSESRSGLEMAWVGKRSTYKPLTIFFYCSANGQVLSAVSYWAANEPLTIFEIPLSLIDVIKSS